jgi:hypothetical protein
MEERENIKCLKAKLLPIIFSLFAIMIILSCKTVSSIPEISATNPKIGIELQSDGHVIKTDQDIPANSEKVFLEVLLNAPEDSKIPLEFKWFHNKQLAYSNANVFPPGYVIATLERDLGKLDRFPIGHYAVEVWFLNTQLATTSFDIK